MKIFKLFIFTALFAFLVLTTSVTSVQAIQIDCEATPHLPSCDKGNRDPFPNNTGLPNNPTSEPERVIDLRQDREAARAAAACNKIKNQAKREKCLDNVP